MESHPIELVVIEASGTLVNDDEAVATALVEALGVFGGVPSPEIRDDRLAYVAHTRGLSIQAVLRSLLGDEDRARYALHAFELALPSTLAQGGAEALPGAEEALTALRQAGRRVCLMSRFSVPCLDAVVDSLGWGRLVDLTITAGAGARMPPHPDAILLAVVRSRGAGVREVAVVAEGANTLVAGTRAGASVVVAVRNGTQAVMELERVPHTHVIDTVAEVPGLLEVVATRIDAA